MKRVLIFALALVLCAGCLFSCGFDKTQDSNLEKAKEILTTMYKGSGGTVLKDFERVAVVTVDGTSYEVEWTVNVTSGPADGVKIVPTADGKKVTVDINEKTETAITFELKATIKDANGNTLDEVYTYNIPQYVDSKKVLDAAYALEKDATLENQMVTGTIISVNSAYDPDFQNISVTIRIEDGTAGKDTILCYRMKGDGADKLKFGDVITVVGTIKNYNGTIEFDTGCTFTLISEGEGEPEKTAAEIMDAAYALDAGEIMDGNPTLTGVITSVDTAYDENYKNLTVTIKVEGANAGKDTIKCYRMKGTGAETLKAGDTITVTGVIKNYNGTIEFDTGCTFVLVSEGTTVPDDNTTKTPAEIMDEAFELEAGASMAGQQTLTGTITSVDTAYDASFSNITVTIKVQGANEGKDVIKCYRMKGTGADALKVGDTITVTGTIKNHQHTSGDTELEFDAGCTFVLVSAGTTEPDTPTLTTAAEIMDAAYALETGASLTGTYTLTGTITSIDTAYDASYKNVTVTIKVTGANEGKDSIQCFRLKGTGAENLKVGDEITVTGTIVNYNGTIEFNSGCTFVMASSGTTTPETPTLTTAAEIMDAAYALEAGATLDGTYTLTGTVISIDTAYSADFKNITLTIRVDGANAGANTISCYRLTGDAAATVKKDDIIKVTGSIMNYANSNTVQFAQGCTFEMVKVAEIDENNQPTATISFASTDARTSLTNEEQVWEQNGVKLTNKKAASTSNVADYSNPLRCYKSSSVKIEYQGMKKIVFNCAGGKNLSEADFAGIEGINVTIEGNVVTVTFTEATDSIEIAKLTNQVRISSIEIYA